MKPYLDSVDVVLCLGLSAKMQGTDLAIIRCCNRLHKVTRREIHHHIDIIRKSKYPLKVAKKTLIKFLEIEENEKAERENSTVSKTQVL